jgi:hypothetical protein
MSSVCAPSVAAKKKPSVFTRCWKKTTSNQQHFLNLIRSQQETLSEGSYSEMPHALVSEAGRGHSARSEEFPSGHALISLCLSSWRSA